MDRLGEALKRLREQLAWQQKTLNELGGFQLARPRSLDRITPPALEDIGPPPHLEYLKTLADHQKQLVAVLQEMRDDARHQDRRQTWFNWAILLAAVLTAALTAYSIWRPQ